MNSWKKSLALATGYVFFFIAAFLVFLYLTFDLAFLTPMAVDAARKNQLDLTIKKASLHRLFSLELKGIKFFPIIPDSEEPPAAVTIDRLVLSPRLSIIPSQISAMKSGKNPPLDLEFSAWIGKGKIKGSFMQTSSSLEFSTKIDKVSLRNLPLTQFFVKGMNVNGTLTGRADLEIKDRNRPETWSGKISADLDKPNIPDFTYTGINVTGFTMDKATMKAQMKNGKLTIDTIKFKGEDIPMDLHGSITFKRPLKRSIVELKGTIEVSDPYKEKMPIISGLLPADGKYDFTGTLDNVIPGI